MLAYGISVCYGCTYMGAVWLRIYIPAGSVLLELIKGALQSQIVQDETISDLRFFCIYVCSTLLARCVKT